MNSLFNYLIYNLIIVFNFLNYTFSNNLDINFNYKVYMTLII